MFHGLDLYYADPAGPFTAAGEQLDDLEHDLSEVLAFRFQLYYYYYY